MRARVIGTAGATTVTGVQLQQAFRLASTWVAFTTITTLAGPAPGHAPAISPALSPAMAIRGLVPFVRAMVAGPARAVHGSVFPARKGDPIAVQVKTTHGWHSVRKLRVGSGGGYASKLPARGTYRVVYRGLNGPAVRVS
jgi:hypothetical protein